MTAQELRRVLTGIGVNATPGELADVLWLAMLAPRPSSTAALTETPAPTSSPVTHPPPGISPAGPRLGSTAAERGNQQDRFQVRLPGPMVPAKEAAAFSAPVHAAAGPGLRNPLPLTRALRPLRRRPTLGEGVEVDEAATADLAAEQRLWLPVFAPAGEPGLDLALVIDTSDSMALWDGLVREFRPLCEQLGTFRDIRSWHLVTGRDGSPSRPALRGAAPASPLRDPRELLDPSGRRLILVITDGVHPWWLPSGPLRPILAQWSKASPVAIIQPFPQRLWDRSAIRPALAEFRANGPGRFTTRLIRPPHRLAVAAQTAPAVPSAVPILELAPSVLDRWARLVAGSSPAATLAAAMLTGEPEGFRTWPNGSMAAAALADPARLVRDFRASVSPSAYRLAGYLSVVAPLSLPVMRLVLESMLPEAGPTELAEVFLGGLLRRLPGDFAGNADRVTYGFAAGVRETLQSTITKGEALTLLDQVGSYLVRGQRGGRPFPAVLDSPVGGDITTASEQYPPFARVARKVLQQIGGPFAEAAQRITPDIPVPDQENPSSGSSQTERERAQTGSSTRKDGTELRTLAYRPWTRGQVRAADSWSASRGQPVSVALSPAGDRLALSIGQRIRIVSTGENPRMAGQLRQACALAPGLAWSPDGGRLAFRDEDGWGRVIGLPEGSSLPEEERRMQLVGRASAMAFIPGGDRLAVLAGSPAGGMTLRVTGLGRKVAWEQALTRKRVPSFDPEGLNLAVSPGGHLLAATTGTPAVWVFETATGRLVRWFEDHSQAVTGLAWIDDERLLSASADATLRIWRLDDPVPETIVETIAAAGLAFIPERGTALVWSARGELLAWSLEGTPVQLWERNPPPQSVAAYFTRPAISATAGALALVDAGATELLLVTDWDRVDGAPPAAATTYANAKILLLGDPGVGKSGLAMVLAGERYTRPESTYGRRVWRLPADGGRESAGGSREVMLWDLAGQPGYRIVNQMHLEGASAALIVFDAKSEIAPLAGVRHWARAVRHAHPEADGGLPAFLVAARADRGGISVSDQRIQELMADFGLAGFFRTSAKEGTGIDLLRSRLLAAIDWSRIPEVTSTALFAAVKEFVLDRGPGILLTPVGELRRLFQEQVPSAVRLLGGRGLAPEPTGHDQPVPPPGELASVFEGCIARLESAGLVKRLKFGDYVLLRPELLDAYAGAMVNAARDEPDGLGSILETTVINVDFPIPAAERVRDRSQERLLMHATLEELLQHELVLREATRDGVQLVFPSAYQRDLPVSEMPRGDGAVFRFQGPVENIYATLIVRLARSDRFRRVDTWQLAARFAAEEGGTCTVALRVEVEAEAELVIGYDRVPGSIRRQFEAFVHAHLERWATPGTIVRERQYSCPNCDLAFAPEMVRQVNLRGKRSILCPVCDNRVSLRDDYEAGGADQSTAQMDASADAGREIEAATAALRGKTAALRGEEDVAEYDVFLSYHWRDKDAVRSIARTLRDRGLRVWMDERQFRPGLPWQPELEEIIPRVPAAAVIIGAQRGNWQMQEIRAFIHQSDRRGCVIVPVLLPDADTADLPMFLRQLTWVNLAIPEPDPIDQLVWGITGTHPNP